MKSLKQVWAAAQRFPICEADNLQESQRSRRRQLQFLKTGFTLFFAALCAFRLKLSKKNQNKKANRNQKRHLTAAV